MDGELILEGKKYISSKRAAKLTGYAKDYVGQLARAGKVDARLVGRSWHVLEDSILAHKNGTANSSEKEPTTDAEGKGEPKPQEVTTSLSPEEKEKLLKTLHINYRRAESTDGIRSIGNEAEEESEAETPVAIRTQNEEEKAPLPAEDTKKGAAGIAHGNILQPMQKAPSTALARRSPLLPAVKVGALALLGFVIGFGMLSLESHARYTKEGVEGALVLNLGNVFSSVERFFSE